ncbi:hypothetical protein ASPNIDRAFT_37346 [Aspergillus niger]|uniref:Uncharacterized protein n=1 Tax=Aspergillus niger TaxID=5061 RepID=A0A100I938_ASPNG|nr:hypothetical protein ASPNIDRAFT_37346 [Aspergillus niger]
MDQMERCTEENSLEDTPGTLRFTRTLARTYRLFGNLFLSEPPLKLRDKVDELRPYLLELEHREKSTEIDHKAISDELSSFQLAETQLWKDPLPTRCSEHIVRPSGSWQARIAHHLHNPSYTTLHAKNGEVADATNGCTALIMNHHYDPELHFMFDHFHRREDFCPFAKYPDHIRAFHENHTDWIRSTLQAKIEIIYGSSVRKWAMKHLNFTSLSLWGEYEGVWLHFEWKAIMTGKKIARIIIFALHPQRFLSYQSRSQREAIEQDLRISVAHQLACLPFTADYHATRLWTSKAEFIQNAYFNEWCLAEKADSRFGIIDLPRQRNVPTSDAACPIITDTSGVMSLKRLDEVLLKVLDSRKRLGSREFRQESKSLNMQNDLLEPFPCALMREWVEAQQHSFFGGISIRTRDDLLFAYNKHCVGARKLIRTEDECEGSFTCHNCSRNDQHFVPVNEEISFISLRDLAIFAFNFSYMDDQTLIAHLDARPSSTFTARSYTRRSQVNLGNANTPGSLDTGRPLKRRRGTRKVDASQVQLQNRNAGEPSVDNDDDPTEPNGGKSMIENHSGIQIREIISHFRGPSALKVARTKKSG